MGNNFGLVLLGFGLIAVIAGAFYKLFLHNKKRSLLIPEYDNRNKNSSTQRLLKVGKFTFGLYLNLQVWIGVLAIVFVAITLLVVLFAPQSISNLFATKFLDLLDWYGKQ